MLGRGETKPVDVETARVHADRGKGLRSMSGPRRFRGKRGQTRHSVTGILGEDEGYR